jgi:hypothetical protein
VKHRLSGNHKSWLNTVAKEIREAGQPASLDFLNRVVPSQFATARNDGHVTAAENGLSRDNFVAGWQIWIEETVAALRKVKLVDGPDDALVWTADQDGTWKVRFGQGTYTLYGRAESEASRDRHMLGETAEPPRETEAAALARQQPGYLLTGWSEVEVEVEGGGGDEVRKGWHTFQVHPLAFSIPPMTAAEQQSVRADIAAHGVRQPLVLYRDAADLTPRGKSKWKVLDGRHRLQFASVLKKPVRVDIFEGSEEEAKGLVASLNLHRRQLSAAQKALAIERLFGEQARAEAKEAQIRKPKEADSVPSSLTEQPEANSAPGGWEHRAVKLAGGADAGVSATSVRHMAEVAKAPETAAKVDSGEIRSVSEASRQAAIELGKRPPENLWNDTFQGELGRARGHLRKALELPLDGRPEQLEELAAEVCELAEQARDTIRQRNGTALSASRGPSGPSIG